MKGSRSMKTRACVALLAGILTISGCGRIEYPALPYDAIAFEYGTYEAMDSDASEFVMIEYNGRSYIPYGTTNNKLKNKSIDSCIGYVIQYEDNQYVTESDYRNVRIYTLKDDGDNNFLIEFDASVNLMNASMIYRALDTKGKEITIPDCIDELGYELWK